LNLIYKSDNVPKKQLYNAVVRISA